MGVMFVSAFLLLVVLGVLAGIAQAWFRRHPAPWSRYVLYGLLVLWLIGLVFIWRSYH